MLVWMCRLWADLGSWSRWNSAFWVDFQLPEQAFCVLICVPVLVPGRTIHPGCCSLTCIWPTTGKHWLWPPRNRVWLSICMQAISQALKEGLSYIRARCRCFGGKTVQRLLFEEQVTEMRVEVGTACSTRSRPGGTKHLVFSNVNPKIPKSCLAKFSQSLQYGKQGCKRCYKYAIIPFLFSHPAVARQSVLYQLFFFPKVIADNFTDLFIRRVEEWMTQPIKHLGHCVPATTYLLYNKCNDFFIQRVALLGFICGSCCFTNYRKSRNCLWCDSHFHTACGSSCC